MTAQPALPPRVSVVMPVYNVAAYVGEAIASVLAQTMGDFELIVVDDGSTDDSPARIAAFADPRIRLIRQANAGLPAARNAGIHVARAPVIAFLDSDDRWLPEKLEQHLAHLAARPDVDVSYSASRFIDEAGRPLRIVQMPRLEQVGPAHIFCRNPVGNGSAPVMRRSALDKVAHASLIAPRPAWFDERLLRSQDIEMWLRMALVGGSRFAGLGAILTEYRMREGGLSAQIAPKYASWLQVAACLDAYAPAFRQRYFARARAYQLRYLARRAVQLGDGRAALRYAGASLASSLAPLWQEPRRTLVTLAAAGAAFVLPRGAIVKLAGWLSGGALVDAPAPARSAA